MRQQARISKRRNKALIGSGSGRCSKAFRKRANCCCRPDWESQAPEVDGHVLINDAPEGFAGRPGDFIEIEITEAHEYDLVARVV